MKIRFINARILTMEQPLTVFFGELWTENELITYVGPAKTTTETFDRTIDVMGNVLMPGFKNVHTHSPMTFLRSMTDDLPLHQWLETAVFPAEALLEKGDYYHLSKVAFAEYLTSGITVAFDMYYELREIVQAAIDFGFRLVALGTVTKFRDSVAEMVDDYHYINGGLSPLVSYRLGFHAIYTANEDILRALSKAADELQAEIWTHTAETEKEVTDCLAKHGLTPVGYINQLGLYHHGGGGFHCVHMSDEDLALYAKKGLYVVTNPSSNTKLASGIPSIQKMLDLGITVAIGTDGPSSGNCLDFFREMFLVSGLGKLKAGRADAVKASDVLVMATVNGAKALKLKAETLSVGQLADIIMIDLQQPNMQPINNIVNNIVYSGSKQNVKMTMIHGRILYENNTFYLNEPISDIYAKAQEITDRIKGKLGK